MDIPAWIDPEVWDGFQQMRRANRWPLTERAQLLIFRKLEDMRNRGLDPNEALDQSTERCYRGVFEPPLKPVAHRFEPGIYRGPKTDALTEEESAELLARIRSSERRVN